jgi:hypothetical protein
MRKEHPHPVATQRVEVEFVIFGVVPMCPGNSHIVSRKTVALSGGLCGIKDVNRSPDCSWVHI